MSPLQADELFACLDRHGILYVLVGGLAAVLHGSPLPTIDADICPSREPDNLRRLAAALVELDARIRTPDSAVGVPFSRDAAFLGRVELLNLLTRFGDLNLAFQPSGTKGFWWKRSEQKSVLLVSSNSMPASQPCDRCG